MRIHRFYRKTALAQCKNAARLKSLLVTALFLASITSGFARLSPLAPAAGLVEARVFFRRRSLKGRFCYPAQYGVRARRCLAGDNPRDGRRGNHQDRPEFLADPAEVRAIPRQSPRQCPPTGVAATRFPCEPGKPLAGLKIALDPGHLGGSFAKMEER